MSIDTVKYMTQAEVMRAADLISQLNILRDFYTDAACGAMCMIRVGKNEMAFRPEMLAEMLSDEIMSIENMLAAMGVEI